MTITYRLMPHLDALLRPDRLIPAADIVADRRLVPKDGGIYGWWFKGEIPYVPVERTMSWQDYRLLYVGIAPREPSQNGSVSNSNLRKRICRNHLGRRIAQSTLRRSLAALLREELRLKIGQDEAGKRVMSLGDESRLTGWMCAHGAVSLMTCEDPGSIETELLTTVCTVFPINIRGTTHEFRERLVASRGGLANPTKGQIAGSGDGSDHPQQ